MRNFTLTAAITLAITLALNSLSYSAPRASYAVSAQTPSPSPQRIELPGKGVDPQTRLALKKLLFADQTLEETLENGETEAEPWRSYASALSYSRQGKTEEAKRELRRVLSLPGDETRVHLWAWAALRRLGERPPASVAGRVQGVVCELHNEAGVGTLAAYADGRARWLGGQGAAIFWEAPGDKEVDRLIANFLKAAEPFVKRAPAADRHTRSEPPREHFRVSVLTFGGIHVTEVYGPEIEDESHFAWPVLMRSVELLNALLERGKDERR